MIGVFIVIDKLQLVIRDLLIRTLKSEMKKFFISLLLIMLSANVFAADVTIETLNKNKETKKEWFTVKSL